MNCKGISADNLYPFRVLQSEQLNLNTGPLMPLRNLCKLLFWKGLLDWEEFFLMTRNRKVWRHGKLWCKWFGLPCSRADKDACRRECLIRNRNERMIGWLLCDFRQGSLEERNISYINKIQQDATVCRYLFTANLLYMFRVSIANIIRST